MYQASVEDARAATPISSRRTSCVDNVCIVSHSQGLRHVYRADVEDARAATANFSWRTSVADNV